MRYTIEIHRDDGSKLYQQVGRFGEDLEVNFPDLVVEDDGTSFWGYTLKTKIGPYQKLKPKKKECCCCCCCKS